MKLFIPFILLSVNAFPCHSAGLSDLRKDASGFGAPEAALSSARVPDAKMAPASGPDYEIRLRKEAMADPDKFIDERSPEEVGIAFGLKSDRFPVTNPDRIQNAVVSLTVDLSRQRLVVKSPDVNGEYKISSGLPPSHSTPGSGKCYSPDTIEAMHYSSLYNNAPMPNTVFFNGNIALHATSAEALLGQPASHGCVRLSKVDSKTIFDLVRDNGKANTIVCVQGTTPRK